MFKFMKNPVRLLMRSNKIKKEKDKIEGCTPKLEDPPSSSHQEEEECNDDEEKECNANNINASKLFVGGLDPSTTSENLKNYFSAFGPVRNCNVVREHISKRSRGFGFVTFVDPDSAKAALEIKDHVLNGKVVDLKPYRSKSSEKKYENRIFLGRLPFETTEEHLREFFSQFGEIENAVIPLEKGTAKSKGFGFLTFKDKSVAEKCIALRFVYMNGKRIIVKKAEPPDFYKVNESLSIDSSSDMDIEEGYEITESFDNEKFRHCDKNDHDNSSVVSGNSSIIEINPEIQKYCQDYFLTKLINFNTMDEKKNKDKFDSDDNVEEVQKLLEDFLMNSSDELRTFGENLIEFSDKSEDSASDEEVEEEEEDTTDDDDCNDPIVKYYESKLQKLNEEFTDVLEKKSRSCAEISEFELSAPQTSQFFSYQKSSMPFSIKDEKGSLVCSLCQWVSPENSCEVFLSHCKTAAHREKLKKRFLSEQNHETVYFQKNKQTQKKCSEAKAFPEKVTEDSHLMKQQRNQKNQNCKEKKPQQKLKSRQQPQAINQLNKKKTEKETEEQKKDKKETSQNIKAREEKLKALKITALAKSMAYIQPFSKRELICKMCNKIVPKAVDVNALMRNVSQHLQSRRHLSKAFDLENSSEKKTQKNDQEQKGHGSTKKKNTGEEKTTKKKNPANALKVEISKKDIPKNPAPALKAQKVSDPKNVSNPKSSAPETVKSNNKKKAGKNAADLKGDYLCLSCKLYFQNSEQFKAHMNSKMHLNSLNNKEEKVKSASNNSQKCSGCKMWLTGSLYDIGEHYVKCLGRQN